MATEMKLPELGENISTGTVSRVLVKVGDVVHVDQPVLEIETEKAVIEVPSSVDGTVREILVHEGEEIAVGQVILTVEPSVAAAPRARVPGQVELQPGETLERQPPGMAEGKYEIHRVEEQRETAWAKAPGQEAEQAPTAPMPAPVQPAAEAPPTPPAAPPLVEAGAAAPPPIPPVATLVPASPSVRRLARELGVDIAQVPGSGPGGRISEEDVKAFVRQMARGEAMPRPTALPTPVPATTAALPDFAKWGEVERRPMSKVRRVTADHLSYAWITIPHVTQYDRADVTDLEALRHRYAKHVEAAGGKLTVTAIIVKVVAAALKVFPQFNASVDMAANEIVYKQYYHIGVAVDTDRGLLVPVVRDVDRKSITEISIELGQAAERARTRKSSLEELQGGTFTVTNLGGIGGSNFAPIINYPEVAILGVARSAVEPVYVDGQLVPRTMLPLSLSYDHRVIDGADGARFLRWVVEALQQPFQLLLEG